MLESTPYDIVRWNLDKPYTAYFNAINFFIQSSSFAVFIRNIINMVTGKAGDHGYIMPPFMQPDRQFVSEVRPPANLWWICYCSQEDIQIITPFSSLKFMVIKILIASITIDCFNYPLISINNLQKLS